MYAVIFRVTSNELDKQMALLEAEGFSFVKKGKKNVYWVVEHV